MQHVIALPLFVVEPRAPSAAAPEEASSQACQDVHASSRSASRCTLTPTFCVQHIMALPLPFVEPPVAPPPAAPEEASSQGCGLVHIPALSTEAPLQPAKLAVWKLFMEQVKPPLLLPAWSGPNQVHVMPSQLPIPRPTCLIEAAPDEAVSQACELLHVPVLDKWAPPQPAKLAV